MCLIFSLCTSFNIVAIVYKYLCDKPWSRVPRAQRRIVEHVYLTEDSSFRIADIYKVLIPPHIIPEETVWYVFRQQSVDVR